MGIHLFLSPHLDDAVLSCGGLIHNLTQRGEQVTVLTVMTGDPPENMPHTPIISDVYKVWELSDDAVVVRREEDKKALEILQVRCLHLHIPDGIYRVARGGDGCLVPLYPTNDSLYGGIHICDDARLALLTMRLPFEDDLAALYMPLGAGNHVDHQLVRDWGLVLVGAKPLLPLWFYEDMPYSLNRSKVKRALRFYQEHVRGLELEAKQVPLTNADVDAKISAIACYESQVRGIWKDSEQMRKAVTKDLLTATGTTPTERYWLRTRSTYCV